VRIADSISDDALRNAQHPREQESGSTLAALDAFGTKGEWPLAAIEARLATAGKLWQSARALLQ
jgi:hypothetical protein